MKFAIFSDIHGNLPAFEAVIADINEQQVDQCICLGDVIGGGAPRECLELVRAMGCPWVKGNHEMDVLDHWAEGQFTLRSLARPTGLTAEQRAFIELLPLVRRIHGFTIVHSSLQEPEEWNYIHSPEAARRSFAHQETPLCFFGHTHIPKIFINDSPIRESAFKIFKPEPSKQYLVNVGSVGNPRDGDKRPAYVIYDDDNQVMELRRVKFNS